MKLFLILLSTVVFLLVMINVFVSLVIYLGQDYHVIDQTKIYEVFQQPIYQKVRSDMVRQNYTILIGDDDSGVKNFIEHQANLHTLEGMGVIIKRYQSMSQPKQQIFSKVKQTRYYLEFALGFERRERTEVFFVGQEYEIPHQQVDFIKSKYPSDNIIIVCPTTLDIAMPGFRRIHFPKVSLKMLRLTLGRFYHFQAQVISQVFKRFNHHVERIFDYFKKIAKKEDTAVQQLIQVDQIEDLNQLSHQLALKQEKKLFQSIKGSKKEPKRKSKKPKSKSRKGNKASSAKSNDL